MFSVRTFNFMYDHTVVVFFLCLQTTRSDIRPHLKWAVDLVIADVCHLISLWDLYGHVWVKILTLSPPMATYDKGKVANGCSQS